VKNCTAGTPALVKTCMQDHFQHCFTTEANV